MRPLSVALATSTFFPHVGGAEITMHNLALQLKKRGHKPAALIPLKHWWRLRGELANFGYPVLPLLPKHNTWFFRYPRAFMAAQKVQFDWLQRRRAFDVWQAFGTFPMGVIVAPYARAAGLPSVVRSVGYDIQKMPDIGYGSRLDPRVDGLIKQRLPAASRVIALSESVVDDFLDVGIPRDKIAVVPCAVDLERFQNRKTDRAAVRAKHGIAPEAFVFISVGRNHPKKGFSVLVEAAAQLKGSSSAPFQVVFVGKETGPLRARAQALGVSERVVCVEEIGLPAGEKRYEVPGDDLIDLYKASDACAFPSLLETFALINIEAMAAGLPVITTDAPGCAETIEPGRDGLVAPAGNSRELARLMKDLMESPPLRQRLVESGLRKVRSSYTWDAVGGQYEELYNQLTGRRLAAAAVMEEVR